MIMHLNLVPDAIASVACRFFLCKFIDRRQAMAVEKTEAGS